MKLCPNCSKEITKKRNKFCSQSCSNSFNNTKFYNIDKTPKNCKFCNKEIVYNKKFCNNSCAASYNNKGRVRTQESKDKLSKIALENNYSNNFKNEDGTTKLNSQNTKKSKRVTKVCKCGTKFITTLDTNERFHCSSKCWRENAGGLRIGSGRGKKGWYKGFYCDSTYELAFVIYNLDKNINFKRCELKIPYEYKGKNHHYHPDFEIDDKIIEIKGYHTEQVDYKMEATIEFGYNIEILYENDLKHMFDHVKENYEYNKLEDLYD